MHGQVVENGMSGSLRSYRGLSRSMEFTAQFDRLGENVSKICLYTDTAAIISPDSN